MLETHDYDDYGDEDCVILTNDPVPKVIGEKKGKGAFGTIPTNALNDMQDDDDIIDYFLSNAEKFTPCPFFLKGNCRYGDKCRNLHQGKEDKNKKESTGYDGDDECCVCLDKVLANGKRFGILDGCDHTFCLDCIRGWRSTYDAKNKKGHYRTCPICRRNSYLVIPSAKLVKSGPEKEGLLEDYREALKEIPCRHFNKGKGACPFMNSCLYAHLLPDGTPFEYAWKDNKINEYGEWEDDYEPTLAERFGQLP